MKRKQLGNEIISTHWWNFGKKKNDFNGTINEWLDTHNVKRSTVKHPTVKDEMGFRFKFKLSSTITVMDIYGDSYSVAALQVIRLYLTLLGDKATITGYRNYRINH